MIIQFKNGSIIKSLSGGECKRSNRGRKQIEKIGKMLVNLDCIDTIYSNQNTNETVLSFASTEEYICVDESYDEIMKQIRMED